MFDRISTAIKSLFGKGYAVVSYTGKDRESTGTAKLHFVGAFDEAAAIEYFRKGYRDHFGFEPHSVELLRVVSN